MRKYPMLRRLAWILVFVLIGVLVGHTAVVIGQTRTWIYKPDSAYNTRWFSPTGPVMLGYEGVNADGRELPVAAIYHADAPVGPYAETFNNYVPGSVHELRPISGRVQFTAPIVPGSYQIRVFPNREHGALAEQTHDFSVSDDFGDDPLELSVPGGKIGDPPPTAFLVDDLVEVTYGDVPLYVTDAWIGLFRADVSRSPTVDDALPQALVIQSISRPGSGSLVFRLPPVDKGRFYFSAYKGRDPDARLWANSPIFQLGMPDARSGDEFPEGLSLEKDKYFPNELINLRFNRPPSFPESTWVGLFKANAVPEGARSDVADDPAIVSQPMTSNVHTSQFQAPQEPGDYVFRIYEGHEVGFPEGGNSISSIPFSVVIDGEAGLLYLPAERFDLSIFFPNQRIEARFVSSWSYLDDAWVGMFPRNALIHGATSREAFDLPPIGATQFLGANQLSGSLWFSAPTERGEYEFIMFERAGDSGEQVAREYFSVVIDTLASLGEDHVTYHPGQEMLISFTAPLSNLDDAWVSAVREDDPLRRPQYYSWTSGILGRDRVEGVLQLLAPNELGSYKLIMYDRGGGSKGYEVTSVSFSVVKPEGR